MIRAKGLFIVLDVIRELNKKYKNQIILHIAGKGDDEQEAKTYVKNYQISNVIFHGFVSGEKKIQLLQKGHILFFSSSLMEGIPIVIIEAMWMGLGLVLHPIGGICDFFTDNMGPKIEKNESLLFKQALEMLIHNPEQIDIYGQFNHRYAEQHFDSNKTIQRLEDIYLQMMKGK